MDCGGDMRLLKTPPPRLPDGGPEYAKRNWDGLTNVLRLYFNRLSDTLNNLIGVNGGQYVDCPYGLFFNTTQQTLAATNTAYPIEFPITYLSNAVEINAGTESRTYARVSGVYNFQFSGQLKSTSASSKQVWVWIVRDGVTIGYSAHQYTLAGAGNHMEINWNFDIDLTDGQYIELQWAADSTDVVLEAAAAAAPHPGIPSAVLAVNFVAPLPDVLPTPP